MGPRPCRLYFPPTARARAPLFADILVKVPMRAEERCVILNDVYGIVISGLDIGHAGVGIELSISPTNREYVLVEDCLS